MNPKHGPIITQIVTGTFGCSITCVAAPFVVTFTKNQNDKRNESPPADVRMSVVMLDSPTNGITEVEP